MMTQDLAGLFRLCLSAQYIHTANDASFAIRSVERRLHILFQWSHGETDWRNNLDFPAAPYSDMPANWRCHRGFLRVWKSAEPYIAEVLAETSCESITVTGYSHGGALAVLCHEYIWFHYPQLRANLYGYGFGAPRTVWCVSGCRALSVRWEHFTVVRNLDDAVTHLPPRLLGYRHMGKILEIGKKGRYTPLDAHRPENYLAALEEYEALRDTCAPSPS